MVRSWWSNWAIGSGITVSNVTIRATSRACVPARARRKDEVLGMPAARPGPAGSTRLAWRIAVRFRRPRGAAGASGPPGPHGPGPLGSWRRRRPCRRSPRSATPRAPTWRPPPRTARRRTARPGGFARRRARSPCRSRGQEMEGVRPGPAAPEVVAEAGGALRAPAAAGHQVLEQRVDADELGARRRIVRQVGAEEKRVRHVADLRLLRPEQLG